MRCREDIATLAVAVMATASLAQAPAHAGGSIALLEALVQIDAPSALTDEIDAALRAANLKADDVVCAAARFGRHWSRLGGARASPYECPIGGKTLHITARHEFRDAMGKMLPPDGPGLTAHAASIRDVDVTWEWK